MMCPITFLLTASGLMIEKVRSMGMAADLSADSALGQDLEAQALEVVAELGIAARQDEQAVDQRPRRDRGERFAQHGQPALGVAAFLLEVRQRDRDGVLAELAGLADRARALVRQTVVADPHAHDIRAPARLLRPHDAAQLTARGLDLRDASGLEARLAALERLAADDDRDGLTVEDVRDA